MFDIRNIPRVTKNLIAINILVLLAQMGIPSFDDLFALHFFKAEGFRPWQLVTHMFMHGGFSHLLFNMFAVFMFGSALEHRLGPKRYLTFYMLTGLGAVLLHFASMYWEAYDLIKVVELGVDTGELTRAAASTIYENNFPKTVGASGAVFGVLAGFAMLYPNQPIYLYFAIPIKAKWLILGYAAMELYLGMKGSPGDNVAHFAHLGGALFGFLLIRQWRKKYII